MLYKPTDKMSFLAASHYKMLLVMSRFGIALGFGDKTIREVCTENQIDTNTFLAIVEILLNSESKINFRECKVSLAALVEYLQNSHSYFLSFRLPAIREKLVSVLKNGNNELSKAVIFYFDEYVAEVKKHMNYEEKTVFPYVLSLLEKKPKNNYNIEMFARQHNQIEARLTEFKNIIIKYYPIKSTNEINSVLFDIFACEEDLASHNAIENRLLVPKIQTVEKEMKN
ncbi:MAG: hemerythrin domain-containing protein [Prevotellaceae bacterium]|jgi:regulator of cell morphogenesis and NO signaling|nr:hemerythrin domain-containing protein [Prevotellaceae bacterium]